jgi:hypothetical protein
MECVSSNFGKAVACAAIVFLCWTNGRAQAVDPSNLSPDLQEVVKLSHARMPDDVIENYINSSGKAYHLSADDIIYLNGQGVSPAVIRVLQTANPTPPPQASAPPSAPAPMQPNPAPSSAPTGPPPNGGAAPVAADAPPATPAEVNFQYFHDQLAPYGTWMTIDGVTYWHPDQAIAVNPDWRPYYDMGQWVDTDNGLYWQSDYTWGDIPFHYGRWVLNPVYGWLWAPDYTWGPAWVFWRHDEDDGAIGWAPLPVGAVFVNGGFFYHGAAVGLDFDFGLGESCFTFVDYAHFHEGFFRMRDHEWAYHIGRDRLNGFYHHSVIRNDFRRDDHGRFVNEGIGHDRIEHLTHVEHASFQERSPVGDRNRLAAEHFGQPAHGEAAHGGLTHGEADHFAGNGNRPAQGAQGFQGSPGAFGSGHGSEGGGVSKVYRPPNGGGSSRDRR